MDPCHVSWWKTSRPAEREVEGTGSNDFASGSAGVTASGGLPFPHLDSCSRESRLPEKQRRRLGAVHSAQSAASGPAGRCHPAARRLSLPRAAPRPGQASRFGVAGNRASPAHAVRTSRLLRCFGWEAGSLSRPARGGRRAGRGVACKPVPGASAPVGAKHDPVRPARHRGQLRQLAGRPGNGAASGARRWTPPWARGALPGSSRLGLGEWTSASLSPCLAPTPHARHHGRFVREPTGWRRVAREGDPNLMVRSTHSIVKLLLR